MSREAFEALVRQVTSEIAGKPLDQALEGELNARVPAGSPAFKAIEEACHAGIREGWMCSREAGGIRFGRVAKPSPALAGFSIDVVHMQDVKGPHHRHPNGEIDMIMPLTPGARFDGRPGGWCVYGPGSAHHPTVSGGAALVLYLLPEGAIEFTKS
jgi:Domain of unknown function (DUF4863)